MVVTCIFYTNLLNQYLSANQLSVSQLLIKPDHFCDVGAFWSSLNVIIWQIIWFSARVTVHPKACAAVLLAEIGVFVIFMLSSGLHLLTP